MDENRIINTKPQYVMVGGVASLQIKSNVNISMIMKFIPLETGLLRIETSL
jgi:hypothetical protein